MTKATATTSNVNPYGTIGRVGVAWQRGFDGEPPKSTYSRGSAAMVAFKRGKLAQAQQAKNQRILREYAKDFTSDGHCKCCGWPLILQNVKTTNDSNGHARRMFVLYCGTTGDMRAVGDEGCAGYPREFPNRLHVTEISSVNVGVKEWNNFKHMAQALNCWIDS